MKRKTCFVLMLALILCCFQLAALAEEPLQPDNAEEEPPYGELGFQYNDYTFGLMDEAEIVMENIGEADDFFVSASCAYQGDDYIYYYDGIEVTVNEIDGVRRITGITLTDDLISIPQGVKIGMTIVEALPLMEDIPYTEKNGVYTFHYAFTDLLMQTDKSLTTIVAIQYTVAEEK